MAKELQASAGVGQAPLYPEVPGRPGRSLDRPARPPDHPFDRNEFARCFEQSYRVLWTLAASVLGERAQAEDVLQEAALIALSKLEQFEPGTSFSAWMGQVVRYVALNHARKRSPTHAMDPEVMDERWTALPVTPEAEVGGADAGGAGGNGSPTLADLPPDQAHFDDAVVAALRTLSPVARACLVLRSVQGLDYRELSRVLGIPEGTAMSHVHRARASLRKQLGPRTGPRQGPGPETRTEQRK
jgi:RNA polymerase sigma-70 factor, ECF subfamily